MVSVNEATQIVLDNLMSLHTEHVPITKATGRILQENLINDRDLPPFDRVTMDGIAIDFLSFKNGQRDFKIEKIGAAGSPQITLQDPANCIEIMTGAMLPIHTDTVIRYEDVVISNGIANIQNEMIQQGQNVHYQGSDRKKHSIVAQAGTRIGPTKIGVAASIGKPELLVSTIPKIQIISTGNELVEVHETPLPHQIRASNVHTIQSTLDTWGIEADRLHLPDDKADIKAQLSESIHQYDVLILSGGVSKGKFDFIPDVLNELGVQKLFHRVKQRPGKPFWFGRTADTFVFALPGNPVSSFMCLNRYFKMWLHHSLRLKPQAIPHISLAAEVHFKPDLTYFLPIKLQYSPEGDVTAIPMKGNGSGDFANMVDIDGFLELKCGKNIYEAGEAYHLISWK